MVIKTYEKGKLVSVKLTREEQHDLALKNIKMMKEAKRGTNNRRTKG